MKEIDYRMYQRLYQGILDYLVENLDVDRFDSSWQKCFEGLIPKPKNAEELSRYSCVRRHSMNRFKKSDYQNAIFEIIAYKYSRDTNLKVWYKPGRSIEVFQGVLCLMKKEKNR